MLTSNPMNVFFDADSVFVPFTQKQKCTIFFTIRLRLFCKVTSSRARHLAMFSGLGKHEHSLFRHVAPVRSKYKIHVKAKNLAFRLAMPNQTMLKFEKTFCSFFCSFIFSMQNVGDKKGYGLHIKRLDTLFSASVERSLCIISLLDLYSLLWTTHIMGDFSVEGRCPC